MARILPDRDIRRLLGSVLINADEKQINPNGIELRLGRHVLFHSSGEEKELGPGLFLRINPGESAIISSLEQIDFRRESVEEHFPGCMLMGFITPTTTMMREGISQVSTKIDAGFHGILNWGLRNGSTKPLILRFGEPIFKLTIFQLESEESPELPYGARETDGYQNAARVMRSTRQIPVDIPPDKVVGSSFDKVDPKMQLREAGYPFDFIGLELTTLDGKFEVVSKDVLLLKEQFEGRTAELSSKIENETKTLAGKLLETQTAILDRVEILFDRKFLRIVGVIIGAAPIMYAGIIFFQARNISTTIIALGSVVVGSVVLALTAILTRKTD